MASPTWRLDHVQKPAATNSHVNIHDLFADWRRDRVTMGTKAFH
jgi:hypothetical protein